jgi:WD40 repeat protein
MRAGQGSERHAGSTTEEQEQERQRRCWLRTDRAGSLLSTRGPRLPAGRARRRKACSRMIYNICASFICTVFSCLFVCSFVRLFTYSAKINSLQLHPTQPHLIVTAGSPAYGGSVAFHDIRKASSSLKSWKPLACIRDHTKSINAAKVSPDGLYLASVSLDDTVRIYKDFLSPTGDSLSSYVYRHDNHTGRWLSTFTPAWDPKHPHAFALGSMERTRKIEVFIPTVEPSRLGLEPVISLSGPCLETISSRLAFHPTLHILAGANSSGKVHLLT